MLPWLPWPKNANSEKILIFATKNFKMIEMLRVKVTDSLYLENKISFCVEISLLSVKFGKKLGL